MHSALQPARMREDFIYVIYVASPSSSRTAVRAWRLWLSLQLTVPQAGTVVLQEVRCDRNGIHPAQVGLLVG